MKFLIFVFSVLPLTTFANSNGCDVNSFYNSIPNTSGKDLKIKLSILLENTHRSISYDDVHDAYFKTDIDRDYDNDGTILDMYSEKPNGKDAYAYTPGKLQCGNTNKESSCYNREHLFPQGFFGKRRPMKTDIHHVVPSDGYVNRKRNNYPFGEVSEVEWTSTNGSKLGWMNTKDYRGRVFEPIDEFKGDIARAMLYFTTRYMNRMNKMKRTPMLNHRGEYSDWFLATLIKWHKQDPVSAHEIRRNKAACNYQRNRNPFVDHPEWVSAIWESN